MIDSKDPTFYIIFILISFIPSKLCHIKRGRFLGDSQCNPTEAVLNQVNMLNARVRLGWQHGVLTGKHGLNNNPTDLLIMLEMSILTQYGSKKVNPKNLELQGWVKVELAGPVF